VLAYLTRRILGMIPALLLASILIFSFMHLAPGDPASLMLGDSATQTQVEQLREAMGLKYLKEIWAPLFFSKNQY